MRRSKKILVIGSTGFVGKNLQEYATSWDYFKRDPLNPDHDLRDLNSVLAVIESYKPDAVVNLAGKVGGIQANATRQGEFFYDNVSIGMNIIEACRRLGIKRLLTALSTCAFPNEVTKYPLVESNLHDGPPAETNFSYGYAKRVLHVMSVAYRKQYGLNYSTFSPTNLYGPHDNFDPESSHFVPACIRRVVEAKTQVEIWGDGKPLRQQLYVKDLVRAIPILLEKHNTDSPLIVAPYQNLSILEMATTIRDIINPNIEIKFNGNGTYQGQFRKDGSNQEFLNLVEDDFPFTSFIDGVTETIRWYSENCS